MSSPNALITDANILISICSKEPTALNAETVLENYAKNGWEFFAPNIIVAEVLYILCQKLQNNLLTPKSYDEAIENFQDQMKFIQTPPDAQFIKRAKEIQNTTVAVVPPIQFTSRLPKIWRKSARSNY